MVHSLIFRLILSALVIFVFDNAFCQTSYSFSKNYNEKLRKADENFHILNYSEAIDLYKDVLRRDTGNIDIICKIANSYRLLNQTTEAESWYKKVIFNDSTKAAAEYIFQFAQTLSCNSKYQEALSWYRHYSKLKSNDNRAVDAIRSLENMSGLYRDSLFYEIDALGINSTNTELAPRYYKDGIIFLSDMDDRKNRMITRYYLKAENGRLSEKPVRFSTGIKAQFNEGIMTFYDNESKVIFSQNYLPEKSDTKTITSVPFKLFMADCDSLGWHNEALLPFQKGEYSYAQPSISSDGKTLFFASDMPGGFGGNDIYSVSYIEGKWGTPRNLGSSVNTEGDEIFPFFRDNILFFSSNGRGGLGEHDIFRINPEDSASLKNLGAPLNSPFDDFGFITDQSGRNGYFSSNRNNEISGDDIYSFKQVKKSIRVKIVDERINAPVSFTNIVFSDSTLVEYTATTDSAGFIEVIVPMKDSVEINLRRENSESVNLVLNTVDELLQTVKISTDDKQSELAGNLKDTSEILYRVQIMASRRPATAKEINSKYKGNMKVAESFEDNWYKYIIGEYPTYAEAKKVAEISKVSDSFIVIYSGSNRIRPANNQIGYQN